MAKLQEDIMRCKNCENNLFKHTEESAFCNLFKGYVAKEGYCYMGVWIE
jgi:hypothetical protein